MSGPNTPWTRRESVGDCTLYRGECLQVMRELPAASVGAVVADLPAGIGFMGRGWDGDKGGRGAWVAYWAERLAEAARLMRPGAHALLWALPRTSHWTALAAEEAGLVVRDRVSFLHGGGFPKSLDVSKALDKAAGAEREVVAEGATVKRLTPGATQHATASWEKDSERTYTHAVTAPATGIARRFEGYGTALKPACEDWWLCMKPLEGTFAANAAAHGVAGINVDACRVEASGRPKVRSTGGHGRVLRDGIGGSVHEGTTDLGRWPANVAFDEAAAAMLDAQAGDRKAGGSLTGAEPNRLYDTAYSEPPERLAWQSYGDSGGPSRFFYGSKAGKADRDSGGVENRHPTVKPHDLMRWLVRMVAPPPADDGSRLPVLDLTAGSGSTVKACLAEGLPCWAIEADFDGEGHFDVMLARAKAAHADAASALPFAEGRA